MTGTLDISPIGFAGRLRIAYRVIFIVTVFVACLLLYPFGSLIGRRNPIPRLFLRAVLRISGARLRVEGEPVRAPAILLANHVSWLDILALTGATGTTFVAHDGLAANPILRILLKLHRTVLIARSDRAGVTGQVDQVRDGVMANGILTLFPEGTTGNGIDLAPFKSSLLSIVEGEDQAICVRPVWLDYGRAARDIAWFGAEPGARNVKRILARKEPITITVHLLEPIGDADRASRKKIAASARQAILDRMDQRVAL